MESLFLKIINMSTAASYVILAVLAARLLMKRAPKKYSYLLWAAVGFRLCCPFSFKSVLSLFQLPVFRATQTVVGQTSRVDFVMSARPVPGTAPRPEHMMELPEMQAPIIPEAVPELVEQVIRINWTAVAAWIWLSGMTAFFLWNLIGELRLRHRLSTAVRLRDNIYQSEAVDSPFVLGLLRPRIYLPYGVEGEALNCVLAHETYHLHRGDPILRRFALFLLHLHWFNPLCWLAFDRMGRDMELSCDEGVLTGGGVDAVTYSRTLLGFAIGRRQISTGLVAFGESGVSIRIKNVLSWKKPRLWTATAALGVSLMVVAVCALNPAVMAASLDMNSFGTYEEFPIYTVMSSRWDLYEEPDENSPLIARLPGAVYIGVLDQKGDWQKVVAGGSVGWRRLSEADQGEFKPVEYEPIPDFLPEELQLLYIRALSFFNIYTPGIQQNSRWSGYVYTDQTEVLADGTSVAAEVLYPTHEEMNAALGQVFTPAFIRSNFCPEENWSEINGRLYSDSVRRDHLRAEHNGFRLLKKSNREIEFELLLAYGQGSNRTCALPIRMVNTVDGWRVSAFTSTKDDLNWMPLMGDNFDPGDPTAQRTETERDDEGRLLRKTVYYSDQKMVVEYDGHGRQYDEKHYDLEDRLFLHILWEYDETGNCTSQISITIEEDGMQLIRASGNGYCEETALDASGRRLGRMFNEYGEAGELRQIIYYDASDTVKLREVCEYDEKGNMSVQRRFSGDGRELESLSWVYKDGRMFREEWRKESSSILRFYTPKRQVEREEMYENGELTGYNLFSFGAEWHWSGKQVFAADGSLMEVEQREFGENQDVIRDTLLTADGKIKQVTTYENDPAGIPMHTEVTRYDPETGKVLSSYYLDDKNGSELEYNELSAYFSDWVTDQK